jgi:hypothetical protein
MHPDFSENVCSYKPFYLSPYIILIIYKAPTISCCQIYCHIFLSRQFNVATVIKRLKGFRRLLDISIVLYTNYLILYISIYTNTSKPPCSMNLAKDCSCLKWNLDPSWRIQHREIPAWRNFEYFIYSWEFNLCRAREFIGINFVFTDINHTPTK